MRGDRLPRSMVSMGVREKIFAFAYDRAMAGTEKAGLGAIRSRLLEDVRGDVLEIGAGTGRNLEHYPDDAVALTLTEPDPSMLRRLTIAARSAPTSIKVLRAPAEDLPFDDASFDTVVSTLVLCGVSDQPRAVREIRRVLKPGGRLLLVEHVRAATAELARRQDRINWLNRLVAGCDCNRPTLDTLQGAGFEVDVVTGDLPKAPSFVRPLIIGAATCPSTQPLTGGQR